MAARSMATASISFGLVTVPVRIYPTVRHSAGLSFHMLHEKDGGRLRQQYVCEKDGEVVPRSEMIKGYEFAKGRYATFTVAELKALDAKASGGIEITEFVPGHAVDPVYFERTYYLGPDKGGAKPYGLLVEAMEKSDLWALARYAARGKDYLVLLRPAAGRIVMQQLYHSDEVRPVDEVPAETRKHSPNELKLATQLIGQIAAQTFEPEKYEDEVRKRIAKLVQDKVKGKDIVEGAPAEKKQRGEVIDLMDALKASLGAGRRTSARKPAAAKATRTRTKTRRAGRAARRSRP
jgi:DNA end-binding protein Ku